MSKNPFGSLNCNNYYYPRIKARLAYEATESHTIIRLVECYDINCLLADSRLFKTYFVSIIEC